jgi:hypothetical protein
MKELSEKIEVGQIYQVEKNFLTSYKDSHTERPVQIQKGEKIEIRYPYKWHFRTEDNEYYHAEPMVIKNNCILLGTITEKVRFANKLKLAEILSLGAYSTPSEKRGPENIQLPELPEEFERDDSRNNVPGNVDNENGYMHMLIPIKKKKSRELELVERLERFLDDELGIKNHSDIKQLRDLIKNREEEA